MDGEHHLDLQSIAANRNRRSALASTVRPKILERHARSADKASAGASNRDNPR